MRERHQWWPSDFKEPALVLHRVVDGLVDSFFPLLGDFDDFIDAVEEGIFKHPSQDRIRRVLKRRLVARCGPDAGHDGEKTSRAGLPRLPGLTQEVEGTSMTI